MIEVKTEKQYAAQTSSLTYTGAKCEECKDKSVKWIINIGGQQAAVCEDCFKRLRHLMNLLEDLN